MTKAGEVDQAFRSGCSPIIAAALVSNSAEEKHTKTKLEDAGITFREWAENTRAYKTQRASRSAENDVTG